MEIPALLVLLQLKQYSDDIIQWFYNLAGLSKHVKTILKNCHQIGINVQ